MLFAAVFIRPLASASTSREPLMNAFRYSPAPRGAFAAWVCVIGLALALPVHAIASGKPAAKDQGAPAGAKRPPATSDHSSLPAASPERAGTAAHGAAKPLDRLPSWKAPGQYAVDMVVTHGGDTYVIKRSIDGTRTRTDMNVEGEQMSMIELGDEAGTTFNILPSQKKVMKQTAKAMADMTAKVAPKAEKEEGGAPKPQGKIEYLGREAVNGVEADKYQMTAEDQVAYAWIDPSTQFPVRMQSAEATVDWKNYKAGPQPEKNFIPPKDYELLDVDEMMAKASAAMHGAGGMTGGAGMAAMGGMAGMGGAGAGGMANHMAGVMGGQFGGGLGNALGTQVGNALGGPLGGMVGNYIGGKVGQMIGKKAAEAVMPGK
jgi:hypothetical protein